MRIWDITPHLLCRQHLLGEHRELHALWTILTKNKKGYRHHPETLRWKGKLGALYKRHEVLVEEMTKRSYAHHSPLAKEAAQGQRTIQDEYVHTPQEQIAILRAKGCLCQV